MAGRSSVKIDADVHRADLAVAKWQKLRGGVMEYISRAVAEAVRKDLEVMAKEAKEAAQALKSWEERPPEGVEKQLKVTQVKSFVSRNRTNRRRPADDQGQHEGDRP